MNIFTSCVSGPGNRISLAFPSIRQSICQFVSTVMAKPFDIWTQNMVQGFTLMKSRTRVVVKVIDQRSRSYMLSVISKFFWLKWPLLKSWPIVWRFDIIIMKSQNDVTTSCDVTTWHHNVTELCWWSMYLCPTIIAKGLSGKRTEDYRKREVLQCWGIFIEYRISKSSERSPHYPGMNCITTAGVHQYGRKGLYAICIWLVGVLPHAHVCVYRFVKAMLCTISMLQGYVVHHRPAFCTIWSMVHKWDLCLWQCSFVPMYTLMHNDAQDISECSFVDHH